MCKCAHTLTGVRMRVYVCACACVRAHVYTCMHLETEVKVTFHLNLFDVVALATPLDLLARKDRDPCLCPTLLGSELCTNTQFFTWVLRTQTPVYILCNKHFTS